METDLKKYGEFGEAIQAAIEQTAERTISALLSGINEPSEKAKEIKHKIEAILAKEFITTQEAAYLLSCSDAHIRNMVNESESGKTKNPIPFTRLGSKIIILHTKSLIEWAMKKNVIREVKNERAA